MDGLVELAEQNGANSTDAFSFPGIQAYMNSYTDQVVQDWSYFMNTSHVGKFGASTLALIRALKSRDLSRESKAAVCTKIIKSELKSVYRALTMYKQAQTVPVILLLEQAAIYAGNEMFNNFDFTLKIIPRLLINEPFRSAFLNFYISTLRHSNPPARRELLANRKIFSNWIGKLSMEDGEDLILRSIDVLESCVLKDTQTFSKSAKMGIFNDWTLKSLVKILSSNPSEAVVHSLSKFLVVLLCNATYGVRMVNGDNKLALSFLKIIKPWDNTAQMDLTLKLLFELPEIQIPYFDTLALSYPLTPKVSMWWFSYTVLHIRFLKLPITMEQLNFESEAQPSAELVAKLVIPTTITEKALMQSLQFDENKLVAFQAAQIVLFALRKLKTVVSTLYNPRKWSSSILIDNVLNSLPPTQFFLKPSTPQLLQCVYLSIVKEMCTLKPQNISLPFELEAKSVYGVDLVIQENILGIQTYTAEQTKWWNPVKNTFSLFTQLLVFAKHNPALHTQCSELLTYLAEPTQMFADMETLSSPSSVLMYTLHNFQFENDAVYKLLDQAVMRSVNSPYKYIDMVSSEKVSPFLVVLFEQYEHFQNSDPRRDVWKWLLSFKYSLQVLGEDHTDLEKLYESSKSEPSFFLDECYDFLLAADDKTVLKRKDLALKISNKLELSACLFRASKTNNEKLRNFLLASVADDFLPLLSRPPAFQLFMSRERLPTFLAVAGESEVSDELVNALQSSELWDLGIKLETTKFLIHQLLQSRNPEVLAELNARKVPVPAEFVTDLLDVPGLAENVLLMPPHSLELDATVYEKCPSTELKCALIRASGLAPNEYNTEILAAIAEFAPSQLPPGALDEAISAIDSGNFAGIAIAAHYTTLPVDVWTAISTYINTGKTSAKASVLKLEFIKLAQLAATESPETFSLWLKVAIHQLTKLYLNHAITTETLEFVRQFNSSVLTTCSIYKDVNSNSVRAVMEAAVNYDASVETYELVSRLSTQFKQSKHYNPEILHHLLSELLDKPFDHSVEQSLLVYCLFDEDKCATKETQTQLLQWFSGSVSTTDFILLSLLKVIESKRQRSWIDQIEQWDIRPASAYRSVDAYEQDPLVLVKENKLFITLDEHRIKETVSNYQKYADFTVSPACDYDTLVEFVENYTSCLPENAAVVYNSEFLLGSVIGCQSLESNIDSLTQSGLLSFVLCACSDPVLTETAYNYIVHVFKLLNPESTVSFKDSAAVRLLLGKLLMARTLHTEIPSFLPLMLAQMALVTVKPNHFMYEPVSNWLLSSPQIKLHEVPLFHSVLQSQSDFRNRETLWFVNALNASAVDEKAVLFFESKGLLDWSLTQYQLVQPAHRALKAAVLTFINRIMEVKGCPQILTKSSGVLSVEDMRQRLAYADGPETLSSWTGIPIPQTIVEPIEGTIVETVSELAVEPMVVDAQS